MSKSIEKRIKSLEGLLGSNANYRVYVLQFHHSLFPPNVKYCENRYLFLDDGSEKGVFIRGLKAGEIPPEMPDMTWNVNPDYDPEWKHSDPYPESSMEEQEAENRRMRELRERYPGLNIP